MDFLKSLRLVWLKFHLLNLSYPVYNGERSLKDKLSSHQELAANILAENLFGQVNEEGHMQTIFKEIEAVWRKKGYKETRRPA